MHRCNSLCAEPRHLTRGDESINVVRAPEEAEHGLRRRTFTSLSVLRGSTDVEAPPPLHPNLFRLRLGERRFLELGVHQHAFHYHPCSAPASIFPVTVMACTARHACSPPRAAMLFSTTCAAVRFAGVCASAAKEKKDTQPVRTTRLGGTSMESSSEGFRGRRTRLAFYHDSVA